ncbi:phosphatidylglycerophosphate synthase [Kitasatospora gansuensis]|uniref:Phosphatidylglycerophosphate synthase n=1 Tax=Kitasatospora gansuensis TaxID=258050 RepID=A0A7W7SJE6_9ACTN|nr:CDP-alcohol phosphatidyltransferase family protein [Kitasatospora gansuensis]MBB4951579.1 phosphatidylglycerophosphate synthase [Kitasatospora gansuensis]
MPTIDLQTRSDEPPGSGREISTAELRALVCKRHDAWWTVLLVDPLALRLVRWTDRHTEVTPDQVTAAALALGLGAAGCFVQGAPGWVLAGSLLYHLSFVLDCVDGKLARLQERDTLFGGWVDFALDRARVAYCAVALMTGQWLHQGDPWYLVLAVGVIFLDMFRSLNVLKIDQIRPAMREQITNHPGSRLAGPPVVLAQLTHQDVARAADCGGTVDLHRGFRHRFPWYTGFRDRMIKRRIRLHLVSGIEFQMAVFIVGPLLGQIVGVTLAAGAALVAFEAAVIYKLVLSFRDFDQAMTRLSATARALPAPPAYGRPPHDTTSIV